MKKHTAGIKRSAYIFIITLTLLSANNAFSSTSFNYYKDDRDFDTMGIFISENNLSHGFSIWGFTDFHSDQNTQNKRSDFTHSFSEYRLSNNLISHWVNIEGLGLQIEYNDSSPGIDNTVWRLGLTYKYIISDQHWIQLRALPLQDNADSQASLIFKFTLHPRITFTGFADYNIKSGKENLWVVEPQFNFRVLENTWLLLELRYNDFERNNSQLDGTGVAVGLRYEL